MTWLTLFRTRVNRLTAVFALGGAGLLVSVFCSAALWAGEVTGWQGNDKSQLRLIAGPAVWQGKQQLFAGIEIRLAPKWKTYWRTPGDTGIPPDFDWSGSENLEKAEVLYPVPVRFTDPTGTSIGYVAGVTLPVRVTAKDPAKPVTLKLNANYAICYDLCVPVEAKQKLTIDEGWQTGEGQRNRPLIEMALASVPVPVSDRGDKNADKGRADGIGVSRVVKRQGDAPVLEFFVHVKGEPAGVDLFIEGPGGLYVPTPERRADKASGDEILFAVDLTQVDDPKQFDDVALTCTVSTGDEAVVQPCKVD